MARGRKHHGKDAYGGIHNLHGSIHHGMTKKGANFEDSSTKLTGRSVDAEATRKGVIAPTPKSLGPRTA